MRIIVAYDALDEATKSVVKIMSDILKGGPWRLDSYHISEVGKQDMDLCRLLVIGGSTSISMGLDGPVPVSGQMDTFLKSLKYVDATDKLGVAFGTHAQGEPDTEIAASHIQDELVEHGFQLLEQGISFPIERGKQLSNRDLKKCEDFANEIRRKFTGTRQAQPTV